MHSRKQPSSQITVEDTSGNFLNGTMMPGQCGIMVVHNFGNKTKEQLLPLLKEIEETAAAWGYTQLEATLTNAQVGAKEALTEGKNKWSYYQAFNNVRTGNQVLRLWKAVKNPTPNVRFGVH